MENKLTALIVDDEERAISLLRNLLEDTRKFSEIRTALSAADAAGALQIREPDLIFLDIHMPGKNGFEFLTDIHDEELQSEIVIVTAHDQHAMEALRNHAFGYLLKPVNREDLNTIVQDFSKRRKSPIYLEMLGKFLQDYEEIRSRLRFNTRAGYVVIDPAKILFCKADGNYTSISTGDKQHVCSVQLGDIEEILPGNGFMRLGRSLIVNFRYISHVDRKKNEVTFEKDGKQFLINLKKAQLGELEKKQGLR